MIDKLHYVGIFSLKDIGCSSMTLLLEQGWLSADLVGLQDHQEITSWNDVLSILKSSHVRLSNDDDMLIWNQAK